MLEAQNRSEDTFRSLVERLPLAIAVFGRAGRLELLNTRFTELFGFAAGDLPDQERLLDLLPDPAQRETVRVSWQAGVGFTTRDLRARRKDGTARDVELMVSIAGDRTIIALQDITEHLALQQARRLDSLGQLAGGVAHDFNNQLACILGFTEMLSNSCLDERQRRQVDKVLLACERAAALPRQMLAFARKSPGHSSPVEVHAVVNEVADILRRTIDRRITVVCELQATASVVVADASQLQNAILNLALNARDAMPDGGTLRFATSNLLVAENGPMAEGLHLKPGRYLLCAVSDTGTGIDPAIRDRIFEPFFTTKPAGAGTGMGLSAVYGTARGLGGDISVDSRLGAGSRFILHLPVGEEAVAAPGPSARPIAPLRSAALLLVDDEDNLREVTADMLTQAGHRVTTCAGGAAAVELLRQRGPGAFDAIILDMVMPGMHGRDAYRAVRAIDPVVPVLIASGYMEDGSAHQESLDGVAGILSKPIRSHDLLLAIERCLNSATQARPASPPG
jgi:PAS domain S-box-containing protein